LIVAAISSILSESRFFRSSIFCLFAKASILNGQDRVPYWDCSCQPPHPFSFSLSHAHQHAVAYLSCAPNCQLGIDLVKKEARDPQKLRGFLTAAELDLVNQYPTHQQSRATNIIWAVKEALSKCLKMGMAIVSSIVVRNFDELSHIQFELTGKALESYHLQKGGEITCRVAEEDQYWVAFASCFTI
jgi:phosphopantetheinyl transferase (holo-ACP synthase)